MRWRWWGLAGLVVLTLAVTAVWSRATSGPSQRDADVGRGLYLRNCAPCHGDTGRGDGASAGGLLTRPADLANGHLMNGLPDAWLVSIIMNGGPAEGLSPAMPPFRGNLNDAQAIQIVAFLRAIAQPPPRAEGMPALAAPTPAPRQPILFSHVIHAGSFQLACQYCHADARRSDYAGLPSVQRCMGCHKIVGAQDNPEIARLHGYANRGEAVPWVRVFKVPEFTYFPHKAHVRAAVACQTCHGPVERMRVVGADTGRALVDDLLRLAGLHPPQRPLTMGWCVECHRAQNATRGTHAPLDCVTCHH
ncbi:MAG: c-type cytochrome [Candidatus Rokubacteria bacterium]|nr:c-type cytochrome [Candidatus Rokubacteria bacterium]MBI3826278.1 c-type cytochrome [Candidatus Rokubacteria bacterium]